MGEFIPRFEDTRLVKTKAGYYAIAWTEPAEFTGTGRPQTRSHSCGTKDRREAEQVRLDWFAATKLVLQHTTALTVGACIETYIQDHVEANGIRRSQTDTLKPVKTWFGSKDIGDVVPGHALEYRVHRLGQGVKDSTIRRELGALRRVFAWTHEQGLWPKDLNIPFLALPPEGKPKKTYIPGTQEQKVFDLARDDYFEPIDLEKKADRDRERIALFTVLALDTAARAEAIETLTLDRIDLVNDIIDYRDPSRVDTRKRRSIVPVSDRLRPVLLDAVRRARARGWKYLLGHAGSTEKLWRSYRERLGVPGITRHDLRRTFATLATQSGVDIWEVAGVLGDTVATTERNYAHHSPAFLRGAVNKRRQAGGASN